MKTIKISNPDQATIIYNGEYQAIIQADSRKYKVSKLGENFGCAIAVYVRSGGSCYGHWRSFLSNRIRTGKKLPQVIVDMIDLADRKAITDRWDARIAAGQNIIMG
jgi:hypothetical protein